MAACPTREELRRYLEDDGSLDTDRAGRIEAHVEACTSCQAVLEELGDEDVSAGTTLPDFGPGYRAYKFLGAGTFGEVWLAQDLKLPRVVAVKTLRVRSGPDARTRALEALRNDGGLLVDVDHPNVVRVYTWLTIHARDHLVMQYVAGGSLAGLLKREGPLGWQRAARYVADVGEGLVEVHARGIVHRDVKPANILWEPRRDEAVLTDFGVGARLSDPAGVAGSLLYMAPEGFDGRIAPSLDVYSLASTLFHLVAGAPPFPGPGLAELKGQIPRGLPDPDPRCRALPEPLEQVIRAGLAADRDRRPTLKGFVATLRGELNRLIVDTLTMPPPPAVAGPTTKPGASAEPAPPAPVALRLVISRQVGPGRFQAIAATHPPAAPATRDMRRVPPVPRQARVRTGERVRIEAVADRDGYLTVFNVGPTGGLNLLYPEDPSQLAAPRPIAAHRPEQVVDVEMTPPTGRERLVAVWSRVPLSLRPDDLPSLVGQGAEPVSRPYKATRDMKRVQQSVQQLRPEDSYAVVLELDHGA
jgi:serine/threonine protein kinase